MRLRVASEKQLETSPLIKSSGDNIDDEAGADDGLLRSRGEGLDEFEDSKSGS